MHNPIIDQIRLRRLISRIARAPIDISDPSAREFVSRKSARAYPHLSEPLDASWETVAQGAHCVARDDLVAGLCGNGCPVGGEWVAPGAPQSAAIPGQDHGADARAVAPSYAPTFGDLV